MAMKWEYLLSGCRLGREGEAGLIDRTRSPFQRDFDRVVFSSSFRRLQDKTQVFPLSENDNIRTRLTHSMEASSIARSLGTNVGVFVCDNYPVGDALPSDVGGITAAAALAHDIGNPPLGHGGEEAIRSWFVETECGQKLQTRMSAQEIADISNYEGNAHGFRVLTKLQMAEQQGGMQLTAATLGAFVKYPCSSLKQYRSPGIAGKKFNYFCTEQAEFEQVATLCRLKNFGNGSYARHPLAFLVEAADDIAYRIVDFEDGSAVGAIEYETLERLFLAIVNEEKYVAYLKNIDSKVRKAEFLRALAIGKLVGQCSRVFIEKQNELLAGELEQPLIELIPEAAILSEIRAISEEKIYYHHRVSEVIAAGFELLSGMLDIFVPAAMELAVEKTGGKAASYRSRQLINIIPKHYAPLDSPEWCASSYLQLLHILDYLSGMTDSYAVSLYKKLKGISL